MVEPKVGWIHQCRITNRKGLQIQRVGAPLACLVQRPTVLCYSFQYKAVMRSYSLEWIFYISSGFTHPLVSLASNYRETALLKQEGYVTLWRGIEQPKASSGEWQRKMPIHVSSIFKFKWFLLLLSDILLSSSLNQILTQAIPTFIIRSHGHICGEIRPRTHVNSFTEMEEVQFYCLH